MTPIEKNIGGNSNLINPIVITASTGHNNNNNTTTTTTTKKRAMKLVNSKRISLWLLPPKPLVTTLTNIQLDLISKHPHQQQQQQRKLLPTFTPHVTLIGGVSISELVTDAELSRLDLNNNDPVDEIHNRNGDDNDDDNGDDNGDGDDELHEAAAKIVLERLKRAFRSFGGIECNFVKERGVFAARIPSASNVNRNKNIKNKNNANGNGQADGGEGCEEGTIVKWNQSCVSIMERSASFLRAMQVAEEALFHSATDANNNISATTIATTTAGTTATTTSSISSTTIIPLENNNRKPSSRNIERHFKPPLYEPHYSFAYGNESIPPSLECPPDFVSSEMSVVWTHPSTLEGVRRWREIGHFSLS